MRGVLEFWTKVLECVLKCWTAGCVRSTIFVLVVQVANLEVEGPLFGMASKQQMEVESIS